jgi:hypothetical protein
MAENYQIGKALKNGQTSEVAQANPTYETKSADQTDFKFLPNDKWRQNVDNYLHFDDFRNAHNRVLLVHVGQGGRIL